MMFIKWQGMEMVKYMVTQKSDLLWGAAVHTVGIQTTPPGAQYPYGEHPSEYVFTLEKGRVLRYFQILYITKGKGWFMSSHCPKTNVQAGDAIIIFPGEWHCYSPDKKTGWTESWIDFEGEFADKIINEKIFDINKPLLRIGISEILCNVYETAVEVAVKEKPYYQQQMAGLVWLIVTSVYSENKQIAYNNYPASDSINLARQYMRENISKNLNMEDVAKEVTMGYSNFRKVFKNYTGFSPAQYFNNLKIEKAKYLLSDTKLSGKEIAYQLGFESVSYFNKVFKQESGRTPQEFRRIIENHI